MDVSCARPPQLFDLLAREWSLSSPVDGVVFNRNCETLAISCENGSIALAETADDDSPTARMRTAIDSGRQTIHRRGGPVPPLTEVALPYVRTSVVVPFGERDFCNGASAVKPQRKKLSAHRQAVREDGCLRFARRHEAKRRGVRLMQA